jgi:hypothetical protein
MHGPWAITAFQGRHGLVRCNPGAVAPSMPDRGTAEVSAQPLKLFASAAMHAAAAAAVQLNEAERNQSRTRHAHHVSRWRKQMASAFAARLIALSGVLRWSTPHTARSAQLPSQSTSILYSIHLRTLATVTVAIMSAAFHN